MNKTNIMLLFVVAVMLAVALFLMNIKTNEIANFTGIPDSPEEMIIENQYGKFIINTKNNTLNEKGVDKKIIDTILTKLDETAVIRRLENSIELKEYGLDKPSMKIKLIWPDRTLNLEYGGRNPHNQGIYASFKGSIYIIDTFLFHQLNKDLSENKNSEVR